MVRCGELEGELAELKALYEQYFLGNERLPPVKKHEAFKKQLNRVKGAMIRQTAVKFRLESLSQKLLTYERLWERSLKEIEAGTFKRDLARVRRKKDGRAEQKRAGSDDFDVDDDLDLSDLDASESGEEGLAAALKAAEASVAKPAAPAIKPVTGAVPAIAPLVTPAAGAPPVRPLGTPAIPAVAAVRPVTGATPAVKPVSGSVPAMKPTATGSVPVFSAATSNPAMRAASPAGALRPTATSDTGLSDTKIKAIYDAYVMAKKRCGEDTRALTLDSVASSLKKQVPELMKQHKAKSVEFKVVIKDGKAVLRALPKD